MVYYMIIILIIVVFGFWIIRLIKEKEEQASDIIFAKKEKGEIEKLGYGLAEYNAKLQAKKAEQKINNNGN